ncbi:MAG: sigma-54-dependent Fis family transcriptional regulator [Alphaproteobacteria bacterium]|nr:sigma-54-dependent Fis family transcriptional regulator [Alphaproteobacteria bacterium]
MTQSAKLLIIDDDASVVDLWQDVLEGEGFWTFGTIDPVEGLHRATTEAFDLILCDVEMPGLRGPELMRRLLEARPGQLVVLITAFGSITSAVEALREGAADFVSKPCGPEALVHVVKRALRERRLRREVVRLRRERGSGPPPPGGLVAESPAMRRVLEAAARVASVSGPVLIQGESGTGKTALAERIHACSPRAGKPFVAVNASTLPEQIAEAELFGARRGAYTDAVQDRPGLLRTAHTGTLFLDEVAELPMAVQAKLLTVVEGGLVRPLGDVRGMPVDVRLIAASNTDLARAVEGGAFRADLRYRLDVLTIRIPPLRERREDLGPLVDHWLDRLAERHGRETLGITAAGWRWLHAWHWPGNVRELINRLERAIVFTDADFLEPGDFDDQALDRAAESETSNLDALLARLAAAEVPMAELQDRYLRAALRAAGGNKTEAARLLGIDRRTVYRKLDEA